MKKKLSLFSVILSLLFLLCCPAEALDASRKGLKLWLETLMPTLLPFLILTGILLRTNGITKILHPAAPFFKKIFGISPEGAYVFLLGLLTGYPMGAKLASDMYYSGKISRQEAEYLLTFCNNVSPVFLTTYTGQICLEGKVPIGLLAGILFLADMICMCFFRFTWYEKKIQPFFYQVGMPSETRNQTGTMDAVIMNSFETMARLGGYILLFSIWSAIIRHFCFFPLKSKEFLLGTLEITTGLYSLRLSGLTFSLRVLFALCISAFGGFCILAQTKSVLGKELSLRPYASAKCMNAAVTAVLTLIFYHLYYN